MSTQSDAARSPVTGGWSRKVLWWVGVLLTTMFGGVITIPGLLALGLVESGFTPIAVALVSAAIVASIIASWVGTLLAPDHTRSRLLAVFGVAAAAAAVSSVVILVLLQIPAVVKLIPAAVGLRAEIFLPWVLASAVIVLSAAWAAWRFRTPRERMGRDALGALIVAIFALIFVLYQYGGVELLLDLVGFSGLGDQYLSTTRYISPLTLIGVGESVATIALGVGLGIWRFRGPGARLGRDAAITLVLVGCITPIVAGTYLVAYLLGTTSG